MMINLTIDNKNMELEEKITILEAAKRAGVKIPTLCHNDKLEPYGGCRICLVEVTARPAPGRSRLIPACCSQVEDGHIVVTDSERVKEARVFIIELLLSRCPDSEELKRLAAELGFSGQDRASLDMVGEYLLYRAPQLVDTNCILCGLCIRVCAEITERHAISFSERGMKRKVKTPFDKIAETCIGCGACAYVCPTDTITIEEAP